MSEKIIAAKRKVKQRTLNQSHPGIHLHLIHIWYCWDRTAYLNATLDCMWLQTEQPQDESPRWICGGKRAKKPDTLGRHVTFPWEPICCVSRCKRGRELEAQTDIYVPSDTRMCLYRSCLFWFCKDSTSIIGHCLWHPTVLFRSRGVMGLLFIFPEFLSILSSLYLLGVFLVSLSVLKAPESSERG